MYEPFPIFDFRQGKLLNRDPWLLPKDAFETLRNCHFRYGVLEKRKGYSEFGQMVHVNTSTKAPTLKTDPVMGIYKHYSTANVEHLLIMDAKRLNKYVSSAITSKSITAFADAGGGNVQVTSAAHGFSDDDIVTVSGTTNYDGTYHVQNSATNTFEITATWVSDDATGTVSQQHFIDLTRNKIRFKHASKQNWTPSANDTIYGATSGATADVEAVVVDAGTFAGSDANGTIIFKNATVSGIFQDGEEIQEDGVAANKVGDADGANTDDEFTGDNTNFFWAVNWRGTLYMTNNHSNDLIQKYDGTNLTRLHIDLDVEGGPDNDVTRCKFIFAHKSHLITFNIIERGTEHLQRGRWCEVRDPTTWKDANWVDADTEEEIMAAGFLGDHLIVWFERSVWEFVYTADPDQPFRWDRIDDGQGCYARMSSISYDNELLALSDTELVTTDGREAHAIDKKIPDFTLTWIPDSVSYSFSFDLKEQKQILITYASTDASAHADGNTYADSALVLNYDDKSFSTYGLSAHVFGSSKLESDVLLDDIGDVLDDLDYSFDDRELESGYPISLMGGRDGKIYKLNDGGSDDGSAIEFKAIGGRWNPSLLKGRKARLGWIDFLVDVDPAVTFDVKSYINTDDTAFQTKTVTCSAVEGSDDKAWHRVFVNAVGRFHRIELTNNATANRPRIHAIVPYFEPAGLLN